MSKQEFLDTLRRALARELSESEVADNINYYWNYIEQQVASGKSEEQVLSELGDPRLIARTILQVDQQKEEAADPYYQNTVYTEDEPSGSYRQDVGADPFEDDFGTQIHVRRLGVSDWIPDYPGDTDRTCGAWRVLSYIMEAAAVFNCGCCGAVDLPEDYRIGVCRKGAEASFLHIA